MLDQVFNGLNLPENRYFFLNFQGQMFMDHSDGQFKQFLSFYELKNLPKRPSRFDWFHRAKHYSNIRPYSTVQLDFAMPLPSGAVFEGERLFTLPEFYLRDHLEGVSLYQLDQVALSRVGDHPEINRMINRCEGFSQFQFKQPVVRLERGVHFDHDTLDYIYVPSWEIMRFYYLISPSINRNYFAGQLIQRSQSDVNFLINKEYTRLQRMTEENRVAYILVGREHEVKYAEDLARIVFSDSGLAQLRFMRNQYLHASLNTSNSSLNSKSSRAFAPIGFPNRTADVYVAGKRINLDGKQVLWVYQIVSDSWQKPWNDLVYNKWVSNQRDPEADREKLKNFPSKPRRKTKPYEGVPLKDGAAPASHTETVSLPLPSRKFPSFEKGNTRRGERLKEQQYKSVKTHWPGERTYLSVTLNDKGQKSDSEAAPATWDDPSEDKTARKPITMTTEEQAAEKQYDVISRAFHAVMTQILTEMKNQPDINQPKKVLIGNNPQDLPAYANKEQDVFDLMSLNGGFRSGSRLWWCYVTYLRYRQGDSNDTTRKNKWLHPRAVICLEFEVKNKFYYLFNYEPRKSEKHAMLLFSAAGEGPIADTTLVRLNRFIADLQGRTLTKKYANSVLRELEFLGYKKHPYRNTTRDEEYHFKVGGFLRRLLQRIHQKAEEN